MTARQESPTHFFDKACETNALECRFVDLAMGGMNKWHMGHKACL